MQTIDIKFLGNISSYAKIKFMNEYVFKNGYACQYAIIHKHISKIVQFSTFYVLP